MAVTVQVRERVGFHRDVYNSLVKCLIRQRKSGEFCDVVLRVNSRRYSAHRAVLAAASPYFRSMFTASMKEQGSAEVDLSQSVLVDADDSFKRVLDFMYCGDIEINVDNVEDVLRIADFLLFDDVKDYCRQFFLAHGNLTLSNCLWVSVLAEHHSLTDVAEVARAMVRSRFHDYFVVCTDELIDLPAPVLSELFGDSDVMRFVSAEHLIGALLRWVQHDLVSRQVQLRWLLGIVAGHQSDVTGLLSDTGSECDLVKRLSTIVDVMSDTASTGSCSTLQEVEENAAYIDDDDEDDADELTNELVRAILEATEPSDPVLVALNCNAPMKYFRIYLYDVTRRLWRTVPLCTEAALSVVPPRLSVCACAVHASVLFLLLAHDLPYPSDLQRVHILAFDVGRGRLALLTFSQRRSRRSGATPTPVHLQTTMTDVRAVPPVLVQCSGYLCVVGNVDAVGSMFVCDPASSTYSCYSIPGSRFVSLARAAVGSDRYVYVWCRHRFGLEAYCVNREVAFAVFDIRRRNFSQLLPPPPGVGYDDFATAGHVLCVDAAGRPVVHSPGRRSYYFDQQRHVWAACPDTMPAWPERHLPAVGEMPYRGCEVFTYLGSGGVEGSSAVDGVYSISNPVPYVTALTFFGTGQPVTSPLMPPPVDGITVVASGSLRSTFCTALPSVQRYDDSFARLVHRKTRQLYDADVDGSIVVVGRHPDDADTGTDSDSSDVEDGLEYDDDIYGYFDDYEYERSINML